MPERLNGPSVAAAETVADAGDGEDEVRAGGAALELADDIAVVRISRLDPQQTGLFGARDADEEGVTVGCIELQALGRARTDVALRADRRFIRSLDQL